MALYDNKYWLLSHIRNSFISTDDTGMCELIMAGEEGVRKHLKETLDFYPDDDDSEDDDDLSHESYDLQLDIDFGMRHRSNTAIRLERMEMAKRKNSRMKHVKWEMNKTPISQEQLDEMFIRREPPANVIGGKTSLLSQTFEKYTKLPTNPYISYAKFDGTGQVNVGIMSYGIYISMLPENLRNYALPVCCIASAKVHELIGLILLKCSTTYEDYRWKPVMNYGLYITEEDGEVDRDFPCLDASENIAKYSFDCLSLVEHKGTSKNVSFDHSETIAISKSFEECLDKRNKDPSKMEQEKQTTSDLLLMDVHNRAMEAPLYKSYKVYMFTKIRAKIEIHLGISGEKIEIDPIQSNSKFALVKLKPISHVMACIAWCEISEVRSNKATFRLVYTQATGGTNQESNVPGLSSALRTSTSFKSYEFEGDHEVAEEIVQKISLLLELRSSETRKEYLASQERKLYKKKHR